MFRLLKGFGVTLNYFTKKKFTIQYPEEKVEMPERFRGVHRFFPEKCIVCDMCVKVCPTDVITLTGKKSEANPKKKVIDTYNIDFQGCILCDFCTEVCPTNAIVMTAKYDNLSSYTRDEHFKDMGWLTENKVFGNYTEPDPNAEAEKPKRPARTKTGSDPVRKTSQTEKDPKGEAVKEKKAPVKTEAEAEVKPAEAGKKEAKPSQEATKPEVEGKASEVPPSAEEPKERPVKKEASETPSTTEEPKASPMKTESETPAEAPSPEKKKKETEEETPAAESKVQSEEDSAPKEAEEVSESKRGGGE
ncbi:4Fe-4S binding protein [Bacillus sp. H-16]|nr:4Fe-4S binding protein [Alteribacter salitolerans]